jgi:hypothetical protein
MARNKNALRGHFVAAYDPLTPDTEPTEWLELAKYISTISDDTEEETDSTGYYDGDGTPETDIISVAGAYTAEGFYDPEDPAQALIAGLKYKTGEGRKIWHRVVSADGAKEWVGRATVSAIVAGSGDASAYETFSCTIRFDRIPEEKDVVPAGDNNTAAGV